MKKNILKLIIIIFSGILMLLIFSKGNPYSKQINSIGLNYNQMELMPDSLPYLGQTRPDTIPLRFGPSYLLSNGIWWWHGSPKFSPDGKEMFFVKYHSNLTLGNTKMYFMKDVNGQWTSPAPPSFAGDSIDNSPVFSRDGNKLYFISMRTGSMKIYFVTKISNGWSQPQLLNFDYQSLPGGMGWDFSLAKDSIIYFSMYHPVDGLDIYKATLINGLYTQFEKLPTQINTSSNEATPYIDVDEKYLMFMSNRPGSYGYHDIYISFKKTDGTWTQAQNMGNRINGPNEDAFPSVTPDGKYMSFNSAKTGDLGYNAYWVDSKIVDKFKPVGIKQEGKSIPKDFNLFQNYPNPFNPSTNIKYQIINNSFITLKVYDILGKEVAVLVSEYQKAGTYEVPFSINQFSNNQISSGVYFYKIETGNYVNTKRMILLK